MPFCSEGATDVATQHVIARNRRFGGKERFTGGATRPLSQADPWPSRLAIGYLLNDGVVPGHGRGHEGLRTIGKVEEGEDKDCSGDKSFHVIVPVLVGTKQRRNNTLTINYSELGRSRPCGKHQRIEVRARQDAERAQEGQHLGGGDTPGSKRAI